MCASPKPPRLPKVSPAPVRALACGRGGSPGLLDGHGQLQRCRVGGQHARALVNQHRQLHPKAMTLGNWRAAKYAAQLGYELTRQKSPQSSETVSKRSETAGGKTGWVRRDLRLCSCPVHITNQLFPWIFNGDRNDCKQGRPCELIVPQRRVFCNPVWQDGSRAHVQRHGSPLNP